MTTLPWCYTNGLFYFLATGKLSLTLLIESKDEKKTWWNISTGCNFDFRCKIINARYITRPASWIRHEKLSLNQKLVHMIGFFFLSLLSIPAWTCVFCSCIQCKCHDTLDRVRLQTCYFNSPWYLQISSDNLLSIYFGIIN